MADAPEYIAFRVPEGDGLVAVIAAVVEPRDGASMPWAKWYSELASDGEFRKVPSDWHRLKMTPSLARWLIEWIQAGRRLPDELVAQLRVIGFHPARRPAETSRRGAEAALGVMLGHHPTVEGRFRLARRVLRAAVALQRHVRPADVRSPEAPLSHRSRRYRTKPAKQ